MNTDNGSARLRSPRTDAARRAQLLAAFDRSGLSAAAFARQQGLSYSTFCAWRQSRTPPKATPAFVQIAVAADAGPGDLVIELGPAARLRLQSENQLALAARLIQRLSAATSC